MSNFALIDNDTVSNVIVATRKIAEQIASSQGMIAVDVTNRQCGVGWNYTDGLFWKDAEWLKNYRLTQINQAVNQYIYQYYDAGTQLSFNALYVHSATSEETKTALESVWAWIQSIMVYYYTQKADIEAEIVTTWDFSQFDATKPDVTLAGLMA